MKGTKVGFWTYYKALNGGPIFQPGVSPRRNISMTATVLTYIIFMWFGGQGLPFSCVFALFWMFSVCGLIEISRATPSLFWLLPVSPVRRTVFFFLSILLTVLLGTLTIAGVFLFILAISMLFFGMRISEPPQAAVTVCLQGELLGLGLMLCILGMAMIFITIKRKVLRRVLTFCIPVFVALPLYFMSSLGNFRFGELFLYFDTLPYSFVYVTVFGVIGAVLTAVGIIRIVCYLKPKNY